MKGGNERDDERVYTFVERVIMQGDIERVYTWLTFVDRVMMKG